MKKINPDSITAVIGCYAQVNPDEASSIEGVNIVVGTNEKNNLPDYIEDYIKQNRQITNVLDYDELNIYDESGSITSMDSRTTTLRFRKDAISFAHIVLSHMLEEMLEADQKRIY